MNDYFIILGAGKGQRFSQKKAKQYFDYNGKTLINHSIDRAIESKLFKKIVIVISKKYNKFYNKYKRMKNILIVYGGKERHLSCLFALKKISNQNPKNVYIHDAARPNFSIKLLRRLKKALKKNIAVVPYIKSKSSIKYLKNNKYENLVRENILLTQTPQCFDYKTLYELSMKNKSKATDEAAIFIKNNKKIKFINGEEKNIKITNPEDLISNKTNYHGIGFDIHKLKKNKKLYLGGVRIPHHSGLDGHSDGDVILHSIVDALLGAMRKGDIGNVYPNTSKKFKNIRSTKLVTPIMKLVIKMKYRINNIDINLICEKPKVSVYRNRIVKSISRILQVDEKIINLKGKTVEKLGLIGKEKAIACECIISVDKYE